MNQFSQIIAVLLRLYFKRADCPLDSEFRRSIFALDSSPYYMGCCKILTACHCSLVNSIGQFSMVTYILFSSANLIIDF